MIARLYNSITLGMLASVLMFQVTWLEMRVNIGWLFFGTVAVLFTLQTVIKPLRKICGTFTASALSLVVSCAGVYSVLGFGSMKIIPASIIREGIMQTRIPFSTINTAIIITAVVGLAVVFFSRKNEH